jgi:hypothetical protein
MRFMGWDWSQLQRCKMSRFWQITSAMQEEARQRAKQARKR